MGHSQKKAIFVLPDIFRKNTCIIVAKIVCNAKTTILTKDSVCFLITEYIEMNLCCHKMCKFAKLWLLLWTFELL